MGTASEPFALRSGMTLTIAVDGGLPATITFAADDFAAIAAATAAEVASVIARVSELPADAADGAVRLRSHRVGDGSRLEVVPSGPVVVSLDGGPAGRLVGTADTAGRRWLAYATNVGAGAETPRRIVVKPYLGRWHDAQSVSQTPGAARSDPALVTLGGGDLMLAWVEDLARGATGLRWRRGTPGTLQPARLLGERPGPFALRAGDRLTLTGFGATETFVVDPADFSDLAAVGAADVAAAMNAPPHARGGRGSRERRARTAYVRQRSGGRTASRSVVIDRGAGARFRRPSDGSEGWLG